jgi:hypothetical protein
MRSIKQPLVPIADFVAQEIASTTYRVQGRFFGVEKQQLFDDGALQDCYAIDRD